jgi:membrane glycosyltransferase
VSRPDSLSYRNRRENLECKSGNIADFCAIWGERYRYMVVMDADSVMTGTSLVNLVRLMERNPHVGIVQAPPLPVNGRTLFSRLHQFAAHAYNSIFITGLNFWQGGAANYWGHNAIIRIRPFVEHCRLPKLSGKEPLGGSILSHDLVEAALMRPAGWKVYLASELHGTYEELPPSLISYAVRDRRWCQGNLQHARLLFTPGLHLVNRIHLWMGVMSYVSAPLWVLALVLSTIESLTETLGKHPYFPREQTLFPTWHISVQHRATLLFLAVMALLMLPKRFSLVPYLRNRESAAAFGGRLKLSLSVLLDIIFSALIAPILATERTRFVVGILLGRNVKWHAQQRDNMQTSLREALGRHAPGTVLGLLWSGLFLFAAPRLFWWFSPVLAGLVLAIPVSVWSSRATAGAWAKRHGLWLIPEEIITPKLLQRLQEELATAHGRCWAAPHEGLSWVLEDSSVLQVHLALLPPAADPNDSLHQHRLEGLQLKVRQHGPNALTPQERRELLLDPDSIRSLKKQPPANNVAA